MAVSVSDIRVALEDAEMSLRRAENVAGDMALLLRGRLRHVSPYVLAGLKRELRDFNIHTKTWKE